MSEPENETESTADPLDEVPKPKRGGGAASLVAIVLSVVNIALTVLVMMMVKGIPAKGAAPGAHAAAAPSDKPGPVATLENFVVNLNEPGSSRYLKAAFDVEMVDTHAADALTRSKRAVRDEVLRYLSNLSVSDTLGAEAKTKIQSELVARIDKELGGGKIRRMYFTDFVVQ